MSTRVVQKNDKAKKPLTLHQQTIRVMTNTALAAVAGGRGTINNAKVSRSVCDA